MKEMQRLIGIMARLRDPDKGCPWDLEQDFASIAQYTVEEAYEVADAIERNDMERLSDELGDLLFQVVFHARMASELGQFTFEAVVRGIADKLERRHPHVFGDAQVDSVAAQNAAWEQHKAAERRQRQAGVLEDVPRALPALKRAEKLTRRAASVGFDWGELAAVRRKLSEELAELDSELACGEAADTGRIASELGDLLFVLANLARHLDIDAEAALHGTNAKFVRRFEYIEAALQAAGRHPTDATLDEMDGLWDEAKMRLG